MKFAYFQGCSLESTAIEFHLSTVEVCRTLGIELVEFDWCCCGASSAHMTDELAALALPAHNLAKAEALGLDMVIPCAGCYNRQAVTNLALRADPKLRERVESVTELPYRGSIETRALLDVLANLVPADEVRSRVTRPLAGLKVASYYGCQLVRPPEIGGWDDRENPTSMDRLVSLAGAEAVDWGYKMDCCGASLAISRVDIAERRCTAIAEAARRAGAECLAVACPLCHANMDQRAGEAALPVLYVTELLGLAFGTAPRALGLNRHIVDCRPLLRGRGLW